MGNAKAQELSLQVQQVLFVGYFERHRMGSVREIAWGTLTGGVNQLGELHPSGEVGPDDAVVVQK